MTRVAHAGVRLLLMVGLLWAPLRAFAQSSPGDASQPTPPPAHLAAVDGTVWLERQGRAEAAPVNMPLVAGDRIRTEQGRVEAIFGDGSALYLDQYTTVDLQSEALLRLLGGRLRLAVASLDPENPSEPVSFRIDAPSAWVEIRSAGEYRVSLVGAPAAGDVELAVLRGSAVLTTEAGSVAVRTGERAVAREGMAPSSALAFNSARWDAFDRWAEARRSARVSTGTPAALPVSLAPYASTLDRYGEWRREPVYGFVWYPAVPVGWRPYVYGHWSVVGSLGWTWIGYDPWAWPTHHFGRWGFSAGLWFWIPGPHWAPAWVSWAWAPGYVAWCPLGFDGWPVVSLTTFRTVIYPGYRVLPPWHAWTVVPVHVFTGARGPVHLHAVAIDRLDRSTRAAFAARRDPPVSAGAAIPRPSAPIRIAGDRPHIAVPRAVLDEHAPATGPTIGRRPEAAQPSLAQIARPAARTAPRWPVTRAGSALPRFAEPRRGAPAPAPSSVIDRMPDRAPAAGVSPQLFEPPSRPGAVPRRPGLASPSVRSSLPEAAAPPSREGAVERRAVPRGRLDDGGVSPPSVRVPAAPRGVESRGAGRVAAPPAVRSPRQGSSGAGHAGGVVRRPPG